MFKLIVNLFGLSVLCIQCAPEQLMEGPVDETILIFGIYYGFCAGNCTHIYKLEDGELYQDNVDHLNPEQLTFELSPLPEEDYISAKVVLENFPEKLLDEEEDYIGLPDAHDQGGYYIEYRKEDIHRFWRIDTVDSRIPAYLANYMDLVQSVVNQLK